MGLIAISSLMLLGGMYLMIAFAWWLLQIIANWRIFTKAGEDGWKSIIPIYGDYISYKIAWQPAYFWLTLVLGIVSSCLQETLETNDSLMISMIIVLIKIILAIISIMYSVKLARAFGRGTGFAIGLIFLQPIFMLILGFGDDRYISIYVKIPGTYVPRIFTYIQITVYYRILLSKYSFTVSQQKSELSVHWSRQITCQTISR